jgi:hypothetical protein
MDAEFFFAIGWMLGLFLGAMALVATLFVGWRVMRALERMAAAMELGPSGKA